jgi:C-terminal processing protease CtpA/Prc
MRLDLKTHIRIIRLILFAVCPLLFTSLLASRVEEPVDSVAEEELPFTKVYEIVATNFADPVDPGHAIFDGAIRGMPAALDPFCSFFDPDQFEQYRQLTSSKADGFGTILFLFRLGNALP